MSVTRTPDGRLIIDFNGTSPQAKGPINHAGNYADWPVWDKLFGTYRAPAAAPLAYGFEDAASRRVGAMLVCIDVNREAAPIVRHD